MDKKNYLYHYTNVEALALILANREIRFKSLDQLDDLQEQETGDIKNIGQFCFESSWTEEAEESIPMWNMYTDMTMGVRIRLRKNPFVKYDCTASDFKTNLNMRLSVDHTKSILPPIVMASGHFFLQPVNGNTLCKIHYTSNKDKLYPLLSYQDSKYTGIKFDGLGKYKNLHWKFQKEWRYVFYALPLPEDLSDKSLRDSLRKTYSEIIKGVAKQPFSYYDLKISKVAFEDMEITMSPHISAGMEVIIRDLVSRYNPKAKHKIKASKLVGML